MKCWRIWQSRLLWFILSTGFLFACGQIDSDAEVVAPTIIVTEVVEVAGETRIVTRVVRQTMTVTATPEPAATAVNGPVELDISYLGEPPNIDPQQTVSPAGIDLMENLFVGLTNFNHIHHAIEPELAHRWDVSQDGRVWTFHLRDDIFWVRPAASSPNDKQLWPVEQVRPVVADDLVYAIQRACDRTTGAPDAFVLFVIEGCEPLYMAETVTGADLKRIRVQALDDYTLQIALTQPASHFLTITTLPLFHAVPREIVEELGEEWLLPQNLITSGPFLPIPGGRSETRLVMHRNGQWPIRRGGNVDIVNVFYLDEEMDIYELWQDKLLDLSPLPASEQEEFMADTPLKARLVTEQTVFYLGYNFDSAGFREAEMRRAFGAAIDREALVEEIVEGQGLPMRHLTAPGAIGALPFGEVGEGYSPDYAAQQINATGLGGCSQMQPIRFLVSTSDISLRRAEMIRDMWVENLGCPPEQIIIEQVQFGTLLANTRRDAGELRPDVWELGWTAYYPDAYNWLGDLIHCNESENRQNRPCSEVDDLIHQVTNTPDTATREALYRDIENMLFGRDGLEPITPLYVPGSLVLVQSWLEFVPTIFGGEQYDTYQIDATLKRLERSRQ